MNIRIFTLSLLIFLGINIHLSAQDSGTIPRDGLSIRIVKIGYQAPYIQDKFGLRNFGTGFEIGYNYRLNDNFTLYAPLKFSVAQLYDNQEYSRMIGLDVLMRGFLKRDRESLWNPYILGGLGLTYEGNSGAHGSIPLGVGMGLNLNSSTQLNLDLSYRIGLAQKRSAIQVGLGVTSFFGKIEQEKQDTLITMHKDSDGDGVVDELDLCPGQKGLKEFNGCPDIDGDGVPDYKDDCPETPGPKEFNGCPDTDGDGIPDKNDECPTEIGPKENNGCPLPSSIDSDQDGVPDQLDECPEQAGPQELSGCPDSDGDGVADIHDDCPEMYGAKEHNGCPDSDGDGIIDSKDLCPNSPGPKSNYGCPEIEKEDKQALNIAMEAVQFETAKATLKFSSFKILDDIVRIMNKYPDYNLRIIGHTDNVGSSQANLRLSENRARSCYEYIASRGIPTSRLSYVGYGESQPRASNATPEGRAKNRRVEFNLYIRK